MACPDKPASSTCYFDSAAPVQTLLYLNDLRKQASNGSEPGCNNLCDTQIRVNNQVVFAHKAILAASSDYFASVFTACDSSTPNGVAYEDDIITINGQSGDTAEQFSDDSLERLIDYAYTKRVEISESSVHSLFYAADCLQFPGVKRACFLYLERMLDHDNCIGMWVFAKAHGNTQLADKSMRMLEENFASLCRTPAFLDLDVQNIIQVLSRDDLCVTSEGEVYQAAMAWLNHSVERHPLASSVLEPVRLQLLEHEFLMSVLENEPLMQNDIKCIPLLIAAIDYKVQSEGHEVPSLVALDSVGMVKPRRPCSQVKEVTIKRVQGCRLGIALLGGADRPGHVFYRGSRPGVRVANIFQDGAAFESSLKVGDRILSINSRPAEHLTHEQAIALMAKPTDHVTLLVRHEVPPPGLVEFTLSTNRGLGFGLCIEGGMNAPPGNPFDPADDGIFVSHIIPGGSADQSGKLRIGHRILQVNTITMLGATHAEALQAMRQSVDRLQLMICDGYDGRSLPPVAEKTEMRRKSFLEKRKASLASIPEYMCCVTY